MNDFLFAMIMIISVVVFLVVLIVLLLKNVRITNKNLMLLNKQFLINLDHRSDRLAITTKLLSDRGYNNVIRQPAVNGHNMSDTFIKTIVVESELEPIFSNKRTQHHQLSKGAIGCSLSHINIYKQLHSESSIRYYIIFEDDTLPTKSLTEVSDALNNTPDDWDILLLGGIYHRNNVVNNVVCKVHQFMCLHAYIINKKCVDYLLKNAITMSKQIDWWLSELAVNGKLNIYGLIDQSWIQNPQINSTNIQTPMVSG